MKYLYIIYIFIQFYSVRTETDQDGWVDPFDMSSGQPIDYVPHSDLFVPSKQIVLRSDCKSDESRSNSFLKRTINMILNSVHRDLYDEHTFRGHLVFEIDSVKYRKLKEFTEGSFDDLNTVDAILSAILKKPSFDYLDGYFLPFCHKILNYVTSRSGIFTICVLSYVIVIYQMMKGRFSYGYILKFIFINIVVFDFIFVWVRLYQTAEIDRLADTVKFKNAPPDCNPKKMTRLEIIWNALSTVDNCKEFYHVTLSDIFWNVSPGDVVVEMFTRTITKPIKTIGPAFGEMILKIYSTLPFGTGLILLPISLIFIMVMTCITLSFLLNTPIKFNFFHLISFSFGDRTVTSNDRIVDRLIDTVQHISVPRIEHNRTLNRQESSNPREIQQTISYPQNQILNQSENENEISNRFRSNENNKADDNQTGNDRSTQQIGDKTIKKREQNGNNPLTQQIGNDPLIENINDTAMENPNDEQTGKNFLERLTEVLNESSVLNVTESGDTKCDDSMEIRKRKRDDGGGDV